MKGQRGGSIPNPNGINQLEGGFARISVGRQTHTWLKQAAASDESISKCMRRLVLQELERKHETPALTGQGREASKATMSTVVAQNESMVEEMKALKNSYSNLELAFCWFMRSMGRKTPVSPGVRKTIREMLARTGGQLNLTERVR